MFRHTYSSQQVMRALGFTVMEKDENGKDFYSLQIQSGLDLASAYYARPELKAERADLERRINRFESQKAFMSDEESPS